MQSTATTAKRTMKATVVPFTSSSSSSSSLEAPTLAGTNFEKKILHIIVKLNMTYSRKVTALLGYELQAYIRVKRTCMLLPPFLILSLCQYVYNHATCNSIVSYACIPA